MGRNLWTFQKKINIIKTWGIMFLDSIFVLFFLAGIFLPRGIEMILFFKFHQNKFTARRPHSFIRKWCANCFCKNQIIILLFYPCMYFTYYIHLWLISKIFFNAIISIVYHKILESGSLWQWPPCFTENIFHEMFSSVHTNSC